MSDFEFLVSVKSGKSEDILAALNLSVSSLKLTYDQANKTLRNSNSELSLALTQLNKLDSDLMQKKAAALYGDVAQKEASLRAQTVA